MIDLQALESYPEPLLVGLYAALCAVIYSYCHTAESKLHARLRPTKLGLDKGDGGLWDTGRLLRGKSGNKGIIDVGIQMFKEQFFTFLRWLMTRSVPHYGKMEWRNIVFLLGLEGNSNGLYIVSKCIQTEGYELAVCHNGTVHRYLIRRFKNNYGINEASQFSDLYGVILLYRTRANGLCCRLERNAWRKDGEELIRQRDMELRVNDN